MAAMAMFACAVFVLGLAIFALTVFALTVLGLTVLGLTVLGLRLLRLIIFGLAIPAVTVAPAAPFRRQIERRNLVVGADRDLGAVGQIGKAGCHHAIVNRKPAGDHRIGLALLRHRDRFCRDGVVIV